MTAIEIARDLQKDNPVRKFAVNRSGTAVGVFIDAKGEYVLCASQVIGTGEPPLWVGVPSPPLVNGKPAVDPADWIPIENV